MDRLYSGIVNDHRGPFLKLAILAFASTPLVESAFQSRDQEVAGYAERMAELDRPIRLAKRPTRPNDACVTRRCVIPLSQAPKRR